MALAPNEVKAIRDSWALAASKASLPDHGIALFKMAFANHPDWRSKFFGNYPAGSTDELLASKKFRAQAAGVMAKVGLWVDCTGDMEVLKESIRGNARNHKVRGVDSSQFELISKDILAYLKSALGGGLNAEMEGAWGKFMDIMVAEVKTEL